MAKEGCDTAASPVKAPLPNCQNALLMLFIQLRDSETPLEMILSFVKKDMSATICNDRNIYT